MLSISNILIKVNPTKTATANRTPSLLRSMVPLSERTVLQLGLLNQMMPAKTCKLPLLSFYALFLPLFQQYRNHSTPYTISCKSSWWEEACWEAPCLCQCCNSGCWIRWCQWRSVSCLWFFSYALFLPLFQQYRNHSTPYTISCKSSWWEETCHSSLWIRRWWCLCPQVRYASSLCSNYCLLKTSIC